MHHNHIHTKEQDIFLKQYHFPTCLLGEADSSGVKDEKQSI